VASDLLDLELRLLLARHGRERVIDALARVSHKSSEGVEEALTELERSRLSRRAKPQKTIQSILAGFNVSSKEISDLLSKAASLLEAKVLFPSRRDAIVFLRKHGADRGRSKSRREVLPRVLRVLSSLDEPQLREILDNASPSSESDYSLLANKIMGKPPAGNKRPSPPA
jgi:hypothetical protein